MNRKCPNCNIGELVFIPADEPWNDEYYQCVWCDSTYSNADSILNMMDPTVDIEETNNA